MREYLEGRAAVQPQPGACEHCHLQALCRVDAQVLAAAAALAADADDDDEQSPEATAITGDAP